MNINNLNDFITPGKAFGKIPDVADISGYESPIKMYVSQMVKQVEEARENEILHTIREEYAIDVDKEELIKALEYDRGQYEKGYQDACNSHKLWNVHQIACMLADIFKDRCACNYCGNDEWLPKVCDLADTSCPDTFGVACWEQFVANYNNKPNEKG